MTARRTPSTTSLSKFARANSPDFASRSLDFCNAFWGHGDGGVDVLFARMRGAARTMEELRNFWKERAQIEDDYAKRLAKLAKLSLGKDEVGELRNSLDTIRLETDKQAGYHLNLAQQIRNDLDGQSAAFLARQAHFKKNYQAAVEKEFKTKHTQESYVNKAREKYEADCVRINSYTAQSTLMQGKDLDRINVKLERAQQTVQANEKDFANFSRALHDTVQKWEQDWKLFCDSAQDLEEERMDFMKDNMWAYANAVSTVCVADDESCEKLRVALEQFEPDKDMENFVRDYGTGNALPDPPAFVNYANPDAVPASSSRITSRPASFVRQSARNVALRQSPVAPLEQEPATNIAGVGSKGSESGVSRTVSTSRTNTTRTPAQANGSGAKSGATPGASSTGGPTTELVIGDNAYQVDPTNDPQTTRPGQNSAGGSNVGKDDDPLAKQMKELRNGSVRKNSVQQSNEQGSVGPVRKDSVLSPPASGSSSRPQDYRNSAEFIVGAYPANLPGSRPVSPSQPTAAMMKPQQSSSTTGLAVETVLADYPQKLPGERNTHSRSNSRQSQVGQSQAGQNKNLERPVSRDGFAGIGSQGRSPSPSFSGSTGPGPLPPRQGSIPVSRIQQPSSSGPPDSVSGSHATSPHRATTPNSVGIALDPSGKVAVDTLADQYTQQPQQPPPQQYHPPPPQSHPNQFNRRVSINNGNAMGSQAMHLPPQGQPPYGAPPLAPYGNQAYMQPPQQPPPIGYANVPPPSHYPPPQHEYQPPTHPYAAQPVQQGGLNRGQSMSSSGYYPGPPQSHQMNGYGRPPSPQQMHNPPVAAPTTGVSAAPTGQYTENGTAVLFYVKALYDYTASIEEEFDFQSGDIIAVTSTPEDGWWSGELLDEARRQSGRHVFPSNFVCLF